MAKLPVFRLGVLIIVISYVQARNIEVPSGYPEGFLFSAGSASYQIEGAWNLSGKGCSVWDWVTHAHPEFIDDRSNANSACDFYHRYKEDIQLLEYLGFQVFRFSISWSRILPNAVIGKVNEEGVKFYHDLLDEILKRNMKPLVTMYHFDLPFDLERKGGWMVPEMADHFEIYADLLFKNYGNKVKMWLTINEPIYMAQWDFLNTSLESTNDYVKAHNLLRAHGKAYRIYEQKYKHIQKGKIGLTVTGPFCHPKTRSLKDRNAAERCLQFKYGWFLQPICSKEGGYPEVMHEFTEKADKIAHRPYSRLPKFSKQDLNIVKGTCDFIGINYYYSKLASDGYSGTDLTSTRYSRVTEDYDQTLPLSYTGFQRVDPKGLRKLLRWISERYLKKDIFITEVGYEDRRGTRDPDRIKFHKDHLRAVREAIHIDQSKVIGYSVWSLLDSFENQSGFTRNFGLISVDFNQTSLPRRVKDSGKWFKTYFESLQSYTGNATTIRSDGNQGAWSSDTIDTDLCPV